MPQTASCDTIRRTDAALADRRRDGRRTAADGASAARPGLRLRDTVSGRFPTGCPSAIGVGVTEKGQSPERGAFAMFGTLTGIATLTAVLVVGGAGLGLLVDDWTSSPHVFVFLGLVLGVLTAVLAVRSIVRRFFR
jgi:hypothetical protein